MENDLNNGHAAYCATTTLRISAMSLYEYTMTFVRHLCYETANTRCLPRSPTKVKQKFRFWDFTIPFERDAYLLGIINTEFDKVEYGVVGGWRVPRTRCSLAKEILELFVGESLAIHRELLGRCGSAVGGLPGSAASIAKGDTIERGTRSQHGESRLACK